MFQSITLIIITKNEKYMVQYGFTENNCVLGMMVLR